MLHSGSCTRRGRRGWLCLMPDKLGTLFTWNSKLRIFFSLNFVLISEVLDKSACDFLRLCSFAELRCQLHPLCVWEGWQNGNQSCSPPLSSFPAWGLVRSRLGRWENLWKVSVWSWLDWDQFRLVQIFQPSDWSSSPPPISPCTRTLSKNLRLQHALQAWI